MSGYGKAYAAMAILAALTTVFACPHVKSDEKAMSKEEMRDLILAQARAGDLDAAEATCIRFIDAWPEDGLGHYNRGTIRTLKGDYGRAVGDLETALSLHIAPRIRRNLFTALLATGRYDEAAALADRWRQEYREAERNYDQEPMFHRAIATFFAGRYEEALDATERSLGEEMSAAMGTRYGQAVFLSVLLHKPMKEAAGFLEEYLSRCDAVGIEPDAIALTSIQIAMGKHQALDPGIALPEGREERVAFISQLYAAGIRMMAMGDESGARRYFQALAESKDYGNDAYIFAVRWLEDMKVESSTQPSRD